MTTANIDEAIERYVNERRKSVRKAAESRFLSYVYLACGESDAATFMRKATRSPTSGYAGASGRVGPQKFITPS